MSLAVFGVEAFLHHHRAVLMVGGDAAVENGEVIHDLCGDYGREHASPGDERLVPRYSRSALIGELTQVNAKNRRDCQPNCYPGKAISSTG